MNISAVDAGSGLPTGAVSGFLYSMVILKEFVRQFFLTAGSFAHKIFRLVRGPVSGFCTSGGLIERKIM